MQKQALKSIEKIQHQIQRLEEETTLDLELFGNDLAKRECYKEHKGKDALLYYLIERHHWLPADVRALSWNDVRFLFKEEMSGWTAPK